MLLWPEKWIPWFSLAKIVVLNLLTEDEKVWRHCWDCLLVSHLPWVIQVNSFNFVKSLSWRFITRKRMTTWISHLSGDWVDILRKGWSWVKNFQHTYLESVSSWSGAYRLYDNVEKPYRVSYIRNIFLLSCLIFMVIFQDYLCR